MAKNKYEKNLEAITAGLAIARAHPLVHELPDFALDTHGNLCRNMGSNQWVSASMEKLSWKGWHPIVYPNIRKSADPLEWSYVFARIATHLAMNHLDPVKSDDLAWHAACWAAADQLIAGAGLGRRPEGVFGDTTGYSLRDENELFQRLKSDGVPKGFLTLSLNGAGNPVWTVSPEWKPDQKHQAANTNALAEGLRNAAMKAIGAVREYQRGQPLSPALQRAKSWLVTEYPLLAALVSAFEIIENEDFCNARGIPVAAVQCELRQIAINPRAMLSYDEMIFVLAHEVLHVGLRHDRRIRGRHFKLWNIACDYVINDWLIQMKIGEPPEKLGYLHDVGLRGLSAEEIYDRITGDLRQKRRLMKHRGWGPDAGDMMTDKSAEWWITGGGVDLDAFYRRALSEGLGLHRMRGRGALPGDLVEEIRMLAQPPIPWDVELAEWLDQYFEPLERQRTYARASRRQSSTPDIIRPAWYTPQEEHQSRTFGVLLDTSGSMSPELLAKSIGATVSYALSRDVQRLRFIQCDARPRDSGWVTPEALAETVEVYGRAGTKLKPAIDFIERDEEFPNAAPLLIITDGWTDTFRCRREHAFLMPEGARLPFRPEGPVFRFT